MNRTVKQINVEVMWLQRRQMNRTVKQINVEVMWLQRRQMNRTVKQINVEVMWLQRRQMNRTIQNNKGWVGVGNGPKPFATAANQNLIYTYKNIR